MNIDKLLEPAPFNKWVGQFLREYLKDCNNVYISRIGEKAFLVDADICNMFFNVMLKDDPEGVVMVDDLYKVFRIWYERNAMYHTNYRLPKFELISQLSQRYDYQVTPDGKGKIVGVELIAWEKDDVARIIAMHEQKLYYQLPNFETDIVGEQPPILRGGGEGRGEEEDGDDD